VLPIRDENPHFLNPVVTRGLIVANALVWVFVQGLGFDEGSLISSICSLGLIPGAFLHSVQSGAEIPLSEGYRCIVGDSTWYTPLTSMFLHGGWLHILGNMWFLWIFGNNVEDSMGHVRFLAFYVLGGLAAAILQVVTDPDSAVPMVGASGAIGGVMGAYLVLYPRVRVHVLATLGFFVTTFSVPAVFMLGYWFVLQLGQGFLTHATAGGGSGGGVAFWAHVGGFLFGALAIPFFRVPEMVNRHPSHGWRGARRRQMLGADPWQS
jgi:membrane associated rhomboid family serine protease